MTKRLFLSSLALLLTAGPALAQTDGGPRGHGSHSPPAEALQACAGVEVGAACTFTSPRGDPITGVCRTGPNGEAAACMPERAGRGHHGPPPEAFQACSGSQGDAACTVTLADGAQLTGTCRAGPDGATLACMPSTPPAAR